MKGQNSESSLNICNYSTLNTENSTNSNNNNNNNNNLNFNFNDNCNYINNNNNNNNSNNNNNNRLLDQLFPTDNTKSNNNSTNKKTIFNNNNNITTPYINNIFQSILTNKTTQLHINTYNKAFQLLLQDENTKIFTSNNLKHLPNIKESMRGLLIDWLIEVHDKFSLRKKTLFLTIYLIDGYLSNIQHIEVKNVQLIGVASLFLACKYEEINPPSYKDFLYITESSYSKKELLDAEYNILNAVRYEVTKPLSCDYIDILQKLYGEFIKNVNCYNNSNNNNSKNSILNTCDYFNELFLLDIRVNNYTSDIVAVSCFYLAIDQYDNDNFYSSNLHLFEIIKRQLLSYDISNVMSCIDHLRSLHIKVACSNNSNNNFLNNILNKYNYLFC